MSKESNQDGVVSVFESSNYTPVWKEIPGFSNYQASDLGVVRRKSKHGYTYGKVYEIKTTVGSYLRVSAVSDDGLSRSKEIHHLVSLAFNGEPPQDGQRYEVNHEDGNKHNNLPSNIEWSTRRDNLIHAYKTGLRQDCQVIRVYDEKEGAVYDIYSLKELGRQFGMTKTGVWTLISNHSKKPYLGRYTFEAVKGKRRTPKHTHIRRVKAYDYKNNKLITADHLGELELFTSLKRGTSLWHLRRDSLALVKGFVVMYANDTRKFPDYTAEEVDQSIALANSRTTHERKCFGGFFLRDYANDITMFFPTLKSVATYLKMGEDTIKNYLKKPSINPFHGYALKYLKDSRPFPDLPKQTQR